MFSELMRSRVDFWGFAGKGDWVRDKGYYIHAKLRTRVTKRTRVLKRSRVLNADDFFFVF